VVKPVMSGLAVVSSVLGGLRPRWRTPWERRWRPPIGAATFSTSAAISWRIGRDIARKRAKKTPPVKLLRRSFRIKKEKSFLLGS
jgi:hypothetical protein